MHLNSSNGSICVLLVNHDTKTDTPVVVPVPPPDQEASSFSQSNAALPSTSSTSTDTKKNVKSSTVIKEETIEERLQSKISQLEFTCFEHCHFLGLVCNECSPKCKF